MIASTKPVISQPSAPLNIAPIAKVSPIITALTNAPVAMQMDMTNDEYHSDRSAISSTPLKLLMQRSPMHMMHSLTSQKAEKACYRIGTAIHAALLERDRFNDEYVIAPDAGRSKDSKAAYQEFVDAHPNCYFISQAEFDMIVGISEQVEKHPYARELLRIGKAEQSFFWTDEETGILCKIRTDLLAMPYAILDVKSTEDASREGFAKSCANYMYDLSAGMYQEGIEKVLGEKIDFTFLAVEKKAPNGIALYKASEEFLAKGNAKFHRALRILKECRDKNHYPSYQPDGGFQDIELPRWYK